MKKLLKLASVFEKQAEYTKSEELQTLAAHLSDKVSEWLDTNKSTVMLDLVIPIDTEGAPSGVVQMYFKPLEESGQNKSDFYAVAAHVRELLELYYGMRKMYFFTRVEMIPEGIEGAAKAEAYASPSKSMYL